MANTESQVTSRKSWVSSFFWKFVSSDIGSLQKNDQLEFSFSIEQYGTVQHSIAWYGVKFIPRTHPFTINSHNFLLHFYPWSHVPVAIYDDVFNNKCLPYNFAKDRI